MHVNIIFLFLNFLILYVSIDQINPGIDMLCIVNSYNRYSNLRKRENTHWHLRNGYFIAVNQFTNEATFDFCCTPVRFLCRIVQFIVRLFSFFFCPLY
jgi:hypothetical protein